MSKDSYSQPLQLINYRNGVLKFQIPASWKAEYEASGGATFYEDIPDSGTLRLNILGFESKGSLPQLSPLDVLKRLDPKREVVLLQNGNAFSKYNREVFERGEKLQIVSWELVNVLPPNHIRIAGFTYTLLASQADDPKFKAEIELLATLIRQATFSRELGISGDFLPEQTK